MGLAAAGVWFFRFQQQYAEEQVAAQLTVVAQLKMDEILRWRAERLADAGVIMDTPLLAAAVDRWLQEPNDQNERPIRETLDAVRRNYGYSDVLIADPSGRVLLSGAAGGAGGGLHPEAARAVFRALRERRSVFEDLHLDPKGLKPHVGVAAPILRREGETPEPLAVVLLQSEADRFLYPLVQSWPVPSRTAEILLVRRDGDEVLFLNELRHRKDTALKFRVPLARLDLPAVQAVLGREGIFRGRDYRGAQVIASIRAIPDMPWFMVAKMDEAEAFEAWRLRSLLILAAILALAAASAVAVGMAWQNRRKEHYKALFQIEQERRQAEERYRVTLLSVGDAVIVTDAAGRVELLNPVAERLTGWRQEEARGMPLPEVFRILNEKTREPVESPVERVMREGLVVGLGNHTVLVARDGTERPIADSGAPIHDEAGAITGVVLVFRDQTEERAAARALKESEEWFRTLADTTATAIYLWQDDRFVYVNRATEKISGFSSEELFQKHFWEIVHPDDREMVRDRGLRRQRGEDVPARYEFRIVRKDGAVRWMDFTGGRIDWRGRPAALGTAIDITEHKEMEQALRESEHMFRTLAETTSTAIFIYQGEHNVYVNEATTRISGYSREEMTTMRFWDLIHPEDRETVRDRGLRRQLGEDVPARYEFRIVRRDGAVRWLDFTAGTIEWQGKLAGLGTAFDITERKQAEAERARLAAAIEQAGEAVVVTDLEGTIRYVNPAFEQVTGYSRREALGRNPRFLKSGRHDEVFYRNLWDTIGRGEIWRGRFVNRRKDGTLYTEEASISPVRDEKGAIVNYLAVKRDITEQLRLAEEKEKLEEQYLQAQKMESVGRLAGGVAHDFNNMLQAILGRAEMAMNRLGSTHPVRSELEEIYKAAQRSADLTRQLLAFARKQTVRPVVLDLNEKISGTIGILTRLLGEDIEIVWAPQENLWNVKVDPAQIDQVLANLAVNARDAISGPGKITIETANAVVDEAYCRTHAEAALGEYVLLTVSDTGEGMAPEVLEHIFEPFFTTKEVGKGTGLGLATVYGIVKQNGGFVNVYSEPGRGSTFKIYLPRFRAEAEPQALLESVRRPLRRGNETILVVEDEEAVLNLARTILEGLGYTVMAERTPAEALRRVEGYQGDVHLLLTDVVMPGMNGRQLAEKLRSLRPGLKCLFMSGYTSNVIAHSGVLEPGVVFIQKPFALADLADKVRQALEG